MNTHARYSVVLSAALLLLACDSGANYSGADWGRVDFDESVNPGEVAGTYSHAASGVRVRFSAASHGAEAAQAVFSLEGSDLTLTATYQDSGTASMLVGELLIDGMGSLSTEEQAALEELVLGELGQAIRAVPLAAGCHSAEVEPAAMAALLLPWQIVLKYLIVDRDAAAREVAAQSPCGYFGRSGAIADKFILGSAAPFPVVFGYFPFDEVGAIDTALKALPASPPISSIGPNDSKCRGACGLDCAPNNCNTRHEWYCLQFGGENNGEKQMWEVHDCGVAAGCIAHDECYDECNATHGAWSFWAADCRHARFRRSCDSEAQSIYGLKQCVRWARGFGPFEARWDFHYPVEGTEVVDLQECPVEDEIEPPAGGACLALCEHVDSPTGREISACRDGVTSQACWAESFPEIPQNTVVECGRMFQPGKICSDFCATTDQDPCPRF